MYVKRLCVLQLVGLLLIAVAAWGKGFGIVSSIHIIGGVIAVGFFLLLIAIVGLIGAVHHHQVMLFFVSFLFGPEFYLSVQYNPESAHIFRRIPFIYLSIHLLSSFTRGVMVGHKVGKCTKHLNSRSSVAGDRDKRTQDNFSISN